MTSRFLIFLPLLTILLTPIIPAYFGYGYEHIKVLIFLTLAVLSAFLLAFSLRNLRWTKIKIAAVIFLIILSITSVLGIHPLESLTGKPPYFQGLILYWMLFMFFLVISEINIKWQFFKMVIMVSSLLVSVFAISDFIFLNFLNIQIPNYAGRVVSTFGQPNLYSGFLLLSLPLIFEKKRLSYLAVFIISLAIILSFSKAAIALLAGFGLWFLVRQFKQKGLAIYLLVVFSINLLVFSLENSSGMIWNEIIRPLSIGKTDTQTVEKRAHILPVMFELYSKSPVLGSGIDSINTLYAKKNAAFSPETIVYSAVDFNLKNLTIDRSHSYFLDILIFSGVLGFLSYLYLIYILFKTPAPKSLKLFLVIYLIWTQFQVQSIAHLMLFWLVAGIIDFHFKKPLR